MRLRVSPVVSSTALGSSLVELEEDLAHERLRVLFACVPGAVKIWSGRRESL